MNSLEIQNMNVEELRDLVSKLERKINFYEMAMDSLPNPVFLKDNDLKFIFFNKKYKDFFGLEENQYLGMGVQDLPYLKEEERVRYHEEDSTALKENSVIHYETSYPSGSNPRESLYWSKGFTSSDGEGGIIGEIVDISKQKRLEEELQVYVKELKLFGKKAEMEATIDHNTKLFNRRILETYVPGMIERCLERGENVFVFIIDIDYFKQVNDNFGHDVGDQVLQSFAKVIKNNIRRDDIAIRYGGDEFLIIFPGMSEAVALRKAQLMGQEINKKVILPNGESVGASIGISSFDTETDIRMVIQKADRALYSAKKAGRGCSALFCKNKHNNFA